MPILVQPCGCFALSKFREKPYYLLPIPSWGAIIKNVDVNMVDLLVF